MSEFSRKTNVLMQHKYHYSLQDVAEPNLYREIFSYLDGDISLDRAVELVQQHSRNYAKRQLTWWRRETDINWISL